MGMTYIMEGKFADLACKLFNCFNTILTVDL